MSERNSEAPLSVTPHHIEAAHRLVGVRIVVVEDEPDTRELVMEVLKRYGAEVAAFASAEAALAAIEGGFRPDILVSDLSLPQVDGWEMIRRVRATAHGRTLPALALSASASLQDAGRALDSGFDVHLAKPVSGDELVAAVLSVVDIRRY